MRKVQRRPLKRLLPKRAPRRVARRRQERKGKVVFIFLRKSSPDRPIYRTLILVTISFLATPLRKY